MNLKPASHRVLIKLDPVEEKSAGGIITTTEVNAKKLQLAKTEGTVVEIGPSCDKSYLTTSDGSLIEKGSHVLFNQYSGVHKHDEETDTWYMLINDEDLFGSIEE